MARKLIPIFDSLTHISTDGRWFHTDCDATASRLMRELERAAPSKACVVSIHGFNMPNEFILEVCARDPSRLIPVAGVNPNLYSSAGDAVRAVEELQRRGFRAIKIHPTLCKVALDSPGFDRTMEACERLAMPVFLCTILRRRGYVPALPPVDLVYRAFVRHAHVPVLFLHSGMSDLLGYSDLVRALPNALMDLSLTIMKYRGSSIDLDIAYLFKQFDRRCVVGSDFPEYTTAELRQRIEQLAPDTPLDKLENVYWRNLSSFLSLDN